MKLHELSPAAGSTKEAYRKGRGAGSGNGKTGGRGHSRLPSPCTFFILSYMVRAICSSVSLLRLLPI